MAKGEARNLIVKLDGLATNNVVHYDGTDFTNTATPQFTGIELGHASDTTITRVSAGVIAVEGTNVMLVGDAPTAHTIASHSDTTGTGAELDTLTGGGDVGALHTHAAAYQSLDAGLTSLAGLTYTSDSFIKVTATDTYAIRTIAETKTDLGLNLVENTALSTWVGSGNITTVGALASGSIATGFTEIATDYTAAKCTDATADNTAGNETSHADVVVDGDFTSNGLLNRTGAGAYSIKTIGTDVQAYHANLVSLAGLTYAAASFIKMTGADTFALRTIGETADDLEGTIDHDNLANGGAHDYAYISGNDAGTGVTAAELEELSDGSETTLHSHAAIAALSAYTNLDSEDNIIIKDHAYEAATDGGVFAYSTGIDAGETVKVYVGATDDPAGAGILIETNEAAAADTEGSVSALVAKGEFFEVTCSKVAIVHWKSFGTLSKPIDQD